MYRYILFDLDGTLTDSQEGIFNALRHALTTMDQPIPSPEMMRRFIGPPLPQSLRTYCHFGDAQVETAMALFREYYSAKGLLENRLAPGMKEVCQALRDQGYVLSLASSKPEEMCVRICAHFGLDSILHAVAGATLDENHTKADVIASACQRLGIAPEEYSQVLMVGDREFDVLGAKTFGMDCVGVTFFGYAEPNELEDAGAVAVVSRAEELLSWIESKRPAGVC